MPLNQLVELIDKWVDLYYTKAFYEQKRESPYALFVFGSGEPAKN